MKSSLLDGSAAIWGRACRKSSQIVIRPEVSSTRVRLTSLLPDVSASSEEKTMLSPRKPYLIVSSVVFSVAVATNSGTTVPSGATSERPAVKAAASDVQTAPSRGLLARMKRRAESLKAKTAAAKARPRRDTVR